jgi:hypothetical protein
LWLTCTAWRCLFILSDFWALILRNPTFIINVFLKSYLWLYFWLDLDRILNALDVVALRFLVPRLKWA